MKLSTRVLTSVLAATLMLSISNIAQAQDLNPLSIQSTMKAMGNKFKQLTTQVNNPALNESSAKIAEELATAAVASKAYTPNTASTAAAKEQYDRMLDDLAQMCVDIAKAFRAGDNAQAKLILGKMNQNKKDGHTDFK